MNTPHFWIRKIQALLHDPPHKPYDFGPEHLRQAEIFRRLVVDSRWQSNEPDWHAAAADRFIFPDGKKIHAGLGEGVSFKHPFSGQRVPFDFPTAAEAHGWISDVFPNFESDQPDSAAAWRERFWWLWRCWLPFSAAARSNKAGAIPYFPADTRIPDGSIWHHTAVVSAFEGCRNQNGEIRPAFLLLQLGPVQEWISQARSTRDLWSGSYLLSWMMSHLLLALTEKLGPDCVIFPSLRGQPIYDYLLRERLKGAGHSDGADFGRKIAENKASLTVPNVPNRLLALVPEEYDPSELEQVFRSHDGEWAKICASVLQAVPPLERSRWEAQIQQFWQLTWQKSPWLDLASTLERLKDSSPELVTRVKATHDAADAIPKEDEDERTKDRISGLDWSAHFQLASAQLDARRSCRDFAAWPTTPANGKKIERDSLSGKEESVIDAEWLDQIRQRSEFAHLFRADEQFGAPNLIKRLWHETYLKKVHGFASESFRFPSVYSVAAESWKRELLKGIMEESSKAQDFDEFQKAIEKERDKLDFEPPRPDLPTSKWLEKVDGSVFQEDYWIQKAKLPPEAPLLKKLRDLFDKPKRLSPPKYYAVIAVDGDQIGR